MYLHTILSIYLGAGGYANIEVVILSSEAIGS